MRDFLNSQPINSDPLSYVICVGQVCLVSYIVSTKFAVVIMCLSSYKKGSLQMPPEFTVLFHIVKITSMDTS